MDVRTEIRSFGATDCSGMNIADIAVFNKVAETLSFTRAGEIIGMNRSAVSKRIARLENDLGVILFNRSPRSISLTEAGHKFYTHTVTLDHTINSAAEAIHDTHQRPSGVLSFTMATSLGASLIPVIMKEFQKNWPDVCLNVHLEERYVDIIGEGLDVAIRIAKKMNDSSLMARRIASTPEILVASPSYLERRGKPVHVRELKNHLCLTNSKRDVVWRFAKRGETFEVPLNCTTSSNNDQSLLMIACLDGGVLRVPQLLVEGDIRLGRLEQVLETFQSPPDYGVYAIYPNRNPPAKVKVFIDFIEEQLQTMQNIDRWNPFDADAPINNRIPRRSTL